LIIQFNVHYLKGECETVVSVSLFNST